MLQRPRTCSLLQSPTGIGLPPDEPAATLLGFGPLQRIQQRKPGYLGFASPDTFRLQGFSPSCRLTSSAAFRPYFVPVTLLGFFLQGLFPSQSLQSLSRLVTFVVLAPPTKCPPSFPDEHRRENLTFKALLSARIRHRRPWG